MNTRKGISPLIATLLLIAIAVAASVLTYSWVMSMVGSQSAQAQTQIRLESVNWDKTAGNAVDGLTIQIRNTGSVAATIEGVTIRVNKAGAATTSLLPAAMVGPFSFDTGDAHSIKVPNAAFVWVVGTSYVIRVTTSTGFYYESVATSPSSLT